MVDTTEPYRRVRQAELNEAAADRTSLENKYGQVWNTAELTEQFDVLGFLAPFVSVRKKDTDEKGLLEFQHYPRFYFNWKPSDSD